MPAGVPRRQASRAGELAWYGARDWQGWLAPRRRAGLGCGQVAPFYPGPAGQWPVRCAPSRAGREPRAEQDGTVSDRQSCAAHLVVGERARCARGQRATSPTPGLPRCADGSCQSRSAAGPPPAGYLPGAPRPQTGGDIIPTSTGSNASTTDWDMQQRDQLLQTVAARPRSASRRSDTACRHGGD